MKWRAPSQRVQFILASPIVVPAGIIAAALILPIIPVFWLVDKISAKMRPSMDWHAWFAWRPVPLGHWSEHVGKRADWAWLERVERRATPYNWPTEYRALRDRLTGKDR